MDDVQWLDIESRDALLFAARRLASDAVAMLFAARTEETGHNGVVASAHLRILRLEGLGISAATELLRITSGVRPAGAVASSLVDATGGNPLALVEVAKQLTAEQLHGTEPLPTALPLSATASQAYASLIDRLPPVTLDALGLFALADGGEAAPVLTAAADLGLPQPAVASLESMGLVRFEAARVTLPHALLAAAATARLTPARQRQMHSAIAAALGGAAPAGEAAVRRTWHLAEATRIPDEDVAAALAAVAADRQRTSSYSAAALALERAATLTPDRPVRAHRYQAAADAASMAGFDEWSLHLLTRARENVDDPILQARLDHARGVRHIVAGRTQTAWTTLQPSADVLQPHDPHQAALVLVDAAFAAFLAGRLEDARAFAARAHQLAANAEARLTATIVEGLTAVHLGDLVPALHALSAPGSLPDLADVLSPVIEYIVPLAIGLTWCGSYGAATGIADRVVDLLRAGGALGILQAALYASAYVNVWQGRLHRAYLHASEAKTLADEGSNRLWQFLATGCLALTEAMRGNLPECRRLAASAQQRWAEVDLWHPRDVEDALGLAALCAGDMPTALRHLEPASTPQPLSPPVFGRPTTVDVVEAYVRAERTVPDTIARQIEAPVPKDFPAVAAAVWHCRGLVGAGDAGEAFEAALARYAIANLPWRQARTLLAYGERLRRAGRRVDARQRLRRAVDLFDDTGSPMWADRAATELAACGGETQRRTAGSSDVLTPQELHVALAVASGATNREVSSDGGRGILRTGSDRRNPAEQIAGATGTPRADDYRRHRPDRRGRRTPLRSERGPRLAAGSVIARRGGGRRGAGGADRAVSAAGGAAVRPSLRRKRQTGIGGPDRDRNCVLLRGRLGHRGLSALYLTHGLQATQSVAALGFAGYQATTLLVRLIGDRLVRRPGAVWTIRRGAMMGTLGLAAVVAAPTPAVAIAGFAVLGLGLSAVPPLSFSAAGHLDERTGIARVNAASYVGFVAGGVLVGSIAAVSTLRLGFLLPLALAAVIVALAHAFAAAG